MKRLSVFVVALLLAGCAQMQGMGTAADGGANYAYERTTHPDGTVVCSLKMNSARAVGGGNLAIGDTCAVAVTTDQITGSGEAANALKILLDKVAIK